MDQLEKVFCECREAILGKPDEAGDHEIIAIMLIAQGQIGGAVAELREAARIDPKNARLRACLALTLLVLDERDEAKTSLEQAIALDAHRADAAR